MCWSVGNIIQLQIDKITEICCSNGMLFIEIVTTSHSLQDKRYSLSNIITRENLKLDISWVQENIYINLSTFLL